MRKLHGLLFLFLAGWCCVAAAPYTHTVSGKVYNSGTHTIVPNASVTLTLNWTGGGTVSQTVAGKNDGSFSISLNLPSTDPKGATAVLKAATPLCSGSTTWTVSSYMETKDVWIFCSLIINPNLSVALPPVHFTGVGTQPPVVVMASADMPEPVVVKQFQVKLAWNAAQMNLANVAILSPDSKFKIVSWFSSPGSGQAFVSGEAKAAPVPLPSSGMLESFFDVFFDVILPPEKIPAIASVTVVPEETQLSDGMGVFYYPYQHQTDYLIGEPEPCQAGFLIDTLDEWSDALQRERPYSNIRPLGMAQWEEYLAYWNSPTTEKEGLLYPKTTFVPCTEPDGMLYAWGGGGGGGGGALEDAGLVMAWGHDPQKEGDYASAWRYDYGLDPDLSNCTIQVTVTPPAPPAGQQSRINAVSFSIIDAANRMRTWWWSVPAAIPMGVPTVVKINTAIAGIGAATPAATGYMNVPGFNITQSQFFDVDENFQYRFGSLPVPPPGQQQPLWGWNYWHNLTVSKNTSVRKWFYIKYSQKPQIIDNGNPPKILGWDERSVYRPQPNPIAADDWPCRDNRPITDIHWWGSFIGWTQPRLPKILPTAFRIGIWTDVPDPDPANPQDFSHPGILIWENTCTNWVWNFAGYDMDPRPNPVVNEACFQFTQLLSEPEWFHQKPGENAIYWLSIAAEYAPGVEQQPDFYPWGWKTRPHQFMDDAVRIIGTNPQLPAVGAAYMAGQPVNLNAQRWDLAFELSTNQPKAPASADLDFSGFVDLADFALFAQQWLSAGV